MCLRTSLGTGYPLTDSNVTAIWWLGTLLRVSVARNARGAERAFSHGASTCRICRTGTMLLPSIILRRCLPAFGSIATEAATSCSGTGRMPAGILYSMSRGVRKTWCRKI